VFSSFWFENLRRATGFRAFRSADPGSLQPLRRCVFRSGGL